jgi:hypothetical protein
MRIIGGLATIACTLVVASTAAAAGPPTVEVPDPCVAGDCRASVTSVALPGEVLTVEVDWEHEGPAETGFVADDAVRCAASGAIDVLGVPVLGLPATCAATGPVYDEPGLTRVAVRVTVANALSTAITVPVRVVPARIPERIDEEPEALEVDLCSGSGSGVQCGPGNGRKTAGGGEKVSHKGWPAITGILWKVVMSGGRHTKTGGPDNDELLGHHGDEVLRGGGGKDVLWGDWDPANNGTSQVDRLYGDAGNDWIYSSHGKNTISGGAGKDYIWAYYGRGTIDCGPGFDTLRIRMGAPYRVRGCERIKNFCSFGSKPGNKGGCYKPGERPKRG